MTTLKHSFGQNDYEIIHREILYQDKKAPHPFFEFHRYQIRHRLFAGDWSVPVSRSVMYRPEAAGVLLYDPDRDEVTLIEQFRAGALKEESPWVFEIVAGINDQKEEISFVAKREALEEAGCDILALMPICRYLSSPGGSTECTHLFCGKIHTKKSGGIYGVKHEGEDIRVHVITRVEAFQSITTGKINNAMTIIALQWLQLHYQTVREAWCGK